MLDELAPPSLLGQCTHAYLLRSRGGLWERGAMGAKPQEAKSLTGFRGAEEVLASDFLK